MITTQEEGAREAQQRGKESFNCELPSDVAWRPVDYGRRRPEPTFFPIQATALKPEQT